ncbi:hypothetical protein BDW22DRAFT_416739 [Trametopsis cervina]|nr:hypothetical protein BDW22DRAFT_416739 [Trametopsis cervina]
MAGQCYWCCKKVPTSELKRCARCRLTTYCSKECQGASWGAGHKRNCIPHRSVSADHKEPEEGSDEWFDLMVDKKLSKWMQTWRMMFQMSAVVALDLAHHPPNRVVTHCMTLEVVPNVGHSSRSKDFVITKAEVKQASEIDATFPALQGIVDSPSDHTRMRYIIILKNHEGEVIRVRCCQWNDLGIQQRRQEMIKNPSEADQTAWGDMLMYAVSNMSPEHFDARFGSHH